MQSLQKFVAAFEQATDAGISQRNRPRDDAGLDQKIKNARPQDFCSELVVVADAISACRPSTRSRSR
jgi:hypothetical protein